MKRILYASVATFLSVLSLASPAQAIGWLCCPPTYHCMEPHEPCCRGCDEPCCGRINLTCFGACHTQELIAKLHECDYCSRATAVKMLGSRLHADFCCDPDVLVALVHALQCDKNWVIRQKAAWAIQRQGARTEYGVLALYLASKLDPHFLVRDAAADALAVLIVGRQPCFKELFHQADELAKKLRPLYKPTKGECVHLMDAFCAEHGISPVCGGAHASNAPVMQPGAVVMQPGTAAAAPADTVMYKELPTTTVATPAVSVKTVVPGTTTSTVVPSTTVTMPAVEVPLVK